MEKKVNFNDFWSVDDRGFLQLLCFVNLSLCPNYRIKSNSIIVRYKIH